MRARLGHASPGRVAVDEDGLPAPGLRFGETRVMALLSCLCSYRQLFAGLTNKSLHELVAGVIPGYSARQMTYDLRRLRRKGLTRVPGSQHYELARAWRAVEHALDARIAAAHLTN